MEDEDSGTEEYDLYVKEETFKEFTQNSTKAKVFLYTYELSMCSVIECLSDNKLFRKINKRRIHASHQHHETVWDLELNFVENYEGNSLLELSLFLRDIVVTEGLSWLKVSIKSAGKDHNETQREIATHYMPLRVGVGCTSFIDIKEHYNVHTTEYKPIIIHIETGISSDKTYTHRYGFPIG